MHIVGEVSVGVRHDLEAGAANAHADPALHGHHAHGPCACGCGGRSGARQAVLSTAGTVQEVMRHGPRCALSRMPL